MIQLTPESMGVNYDLSHAHSAFVKQYDGGKMDGADLVPIACNVAPCPMNRQYFYVQSSDVQPYFQMAEQYTFGDRMFQTNEGPSFPAHQFIISGTSAPTATSNLFVLSRKTPAAVPAALRLPRQTSSWSILRARSRARFTPARSTRR
jgi:phospholipase C